MTKGSVGFFYTGSVLHNESTGQERAAAGPELDLLFGLELRQEENQYLSCPPDWRKILIRKLQDLLGYTQGEYALGYFSDPLDETGQREIVSPEYVLGRTPEAMTLGGLP